MDEFVNQLGQLPPWLGSAPMWGVFLLVLAAFIKVWPQLRQQNIDERGQAHERYLDRIKELKREVAECRRICDENDTRHASEIRDLQDELYGLRKQHVQEQISLINSIIDSVDNPSLKQLLKTMESVQRNLPQPIPGVRADARDEGDIL